MDGNDINVASCSSNLFFHKIESLNDSFWPRTSIGNHVRMWGTHSQITYGAQTPASCYSLPFIPY